MNLEASRVLFIGIDPGLHGGIAALNEYGALEYVVPMPVLQLPPSGAKTKAGNPKQGRRYVSGVQLRKIVRDQRIESVALEWVWSRPKESPSVSFGFGAAYGTVRGAFEVLHPTTLITPQKWKKRYGLPGGDEGKDAARALATEMWPSHDRHFNKNKKRGAGLADALLIAHDHRLKEVG